MYYSVDIFTMDKPEYPLSDEKEESKANTASTSVLCYITGIGYEKLSFGEALKRTFEEIPCTPLTKMRAMYLLNSRMKELND